MQLFNKKGSSGGPTFGAWHPNFRNTEELPDTKTVRTKFFINSGAVVVAICVIIYYFYTEYNIRAVSAEVRGWEEQIKRDSKASQSAVALYKKYKEEEAKVTEAANFIKGDKLVYSDFVMQIAQTLPENISISSIQYRETDLILRGLVRGAPELASGMASAYEKKLRDDAELSANFTSISLTNLVPSSSTGGLTFDIVMKFKKTSP